mmetsp:Transcript_16056/g.24919  ORF Transcript_16056/g.24919 Transcript_16056/m.24919 type:complete len:112 (-) Transcript_16056:12-347(-)
MEDDDMLKDLFNGQGIPQQNLPEGIDNVDVSDIQKMINNSGESPLESHPSPGLEQFNREMQDLENADKLNFYDNLQKIEDGDLGDEDLEAQMEGHHFDDMDPEDMMNMMLK